MPLPLQSAEGIMFLGCPCMRACVRPSVRPDTYLWELVQILWKHPAWHYQELLKHLGFVGQRSSS